MISVFSFLFFFQAEDGIRDRNVTGVQTCALPISERVLADLARAGISLDAITEELVNDGVKLFAEAADKLLGAVAQKRAKLQIGRASCRERVKHSYGTVQLTNT